MTRMRIGVAVALSMTVAGLLFWQISRERRVAQCHAVGHVWNGATSTCERPRSAPILQRDNLKRACVHRYLGKWQVAELVGAVTLLMHTVFERHHNA